MAIKKVDISPHRSTTSEPSPRSQTQIDTDRHVECNYGSEGWGFRGTVWSSGTTAASVAQAATDRASCVALKGESELTE